MENAKAVGRISKMRVPDTATFIQRVTTGKRQSSSHIHNKFIYLFLL